MVREEFSTSVCVSGCMSYCVRAYVECLLSMSGYQLRLVCGYSCIITLLTLGNHAFLFSCTPTGMLKYSMKIALSSPEADGGRLIIVLCHICCIVPLNTNLQLF